MKKIVLLSLSVFAAFSLSAQQPRDWAQYGRYERQNAALAGEPVEVVFMGNSITDNWIGADPDFFARNGFVDRGISGQTTAEMLARFRRDVIDLNPKAVVILAGINDIAQNNGAIKLENVFGNIVSMCELAKFNGIRVVLCSVLPCDRFSWRPEIKPAAAVAELNTMLRQYAAEHKIPLCGLPCGAGQRLRRPGRPDLPGRLPSDPVRLHAHGADGRRGDQQGPPYEAGAVYHPDTQRITDNR